MTDLKPSKSARKREDKERQALGIRLIDIDTADLQTYGLDTSLFDAIVAAKSMRSHGALRRQKQLIGKLMRSADVAAIETALNSGTENAAREKRVFRHAEAWRDRLLKDPSGALVELEGLSIDVTPIKAILRHLANAHGDREQKRQNRELFRALRAALESAE